MICKRCGNECLDAINETNHAEIECPECNGAGCSECDDGFFKLTTCARKIVDSYLITAINFACYADKGFLPQQGGLLDQSAWWLALWLQLSNEQNKIDVAQSEKAK